MQENLNPRKSPGYDLIARIILKTMPRKGIVQLTTICNAIIRTWFSPVQWSVAQIIIISKPSKPLGEARSYRPISQLAIMSNILEKSMIKRLRPIEDENRILPDHQFGFRQKHTTMKQVHRITEVIRLTLEKAVLLWGLPRYHTNLWWNMAARPLFKIRKILPRAI
jgi:hypothetical protein